MSLSCSSTALCFTCAWYSSIVTVGLLHLLLVQAINISYNVTEREARLALRDKSARSAYCGLVVDTGIYSRGFSANWTEFMQMGEKMNYPSPAPTNTVWEGWSWKPWKIVWTSWWHDVLFVSTGWRRDSLMVLVVFAGLVELFLAESLRASCLEWHNLPTANLTLLFWFNLKCMFVCLFFKNNNSKYWLDKQRNSNGI